MVIPAMQLAGKIPDVHVQLWASALLKGLLYCTGALCVFSCADDCLFAVICVILCIRGMLRKYAN